MRLVGELIVIPALLLGVGAAACGDGEAETGDDGGVTACRGWVEEVDACGGWLGFDDAWCDAFRLEVEDGCDCQNVIDWYRENSACDDGLYGFGDGADSADLPSCACPTGPVNL